MGHFNPLLLLDPYLRDTNLSRWLPERSVVQPLWDYLRVHHEDSLRSPLFPVIISVSAYLLLCAAFMLLDACALGFPSLSRYKIHQDSRLNWDDSAKTLRLTAYNHLVFIFPAAAAQWYWRPPVPLPQEAPPLGELLVGVLGCSLLFDLQYYVWHRLHHRVRWLYNTFHAVHHEYSEPFSWVTQYLSAWELISVGFWATLDPLLLGCHCLTGWAFLLFNVFISVDDHCGYDFSWSLHSLVPLGLFGGSIKHSSHHQRPATNFSPFFTHLDRMFGTYSEPDRSPAMSGGRRRGGGGGGEAEITAETHPVGH